MSLFPQLAWPRQAFARTRKRWRRVHSLRMLRKLGITSYFEGYPPEAFPPQYDDLFGLYLLTLQRRPAVLLELGGGYSTFVLAHAARELSRQQYPIEFHSVDESDHWQQVVKDRMPKELLPFIRFWRSDPKLTELNGEVVSVFASLPVNTANLVYVDGGLVPGNNIGGDAVLLEPQAPQDYAVLVDNRKRTVAFLRRALANQYAVGPGLMGLQT
jgi:hypothetical protein